MMITQEEIQQGSIPDVYNRIEELQSLGKAISKEQKKEYKRLIEEYNKLVGFKAMHV